MVEQSSEDLSLLSEIIINSDSDQSMGLMENMMETNSDNASLLMTEIVEQEFDIFSHVSEAQSGNFENLRESISKTSIISFKKDNLFEGSKDLIMEINLAKSPLKYPHPRKIVSLNNYKFYGLLRQVHLY